MKHVKWVGILLMTAPLQGCFHWTNRTSEGIVRDGYARRFEEPYQPQSLYCYRTLGDNDCYDRPLPQREHNRLESFYKPEVDLMADTAQARKTAPAPSPGPLATERLEP
ncbi:MAG: hypothetical protein ACK5O7_02975 [Holosporales bacterium]